MNAPKPTPESSHLTYLKRLEKRLSDQTNDLETRHMEAAIDAQISRCPNDDNRTDVVFDDYVNPDAVPNCLSPFVPATAQQIGSFLDFLRCRYDSSGPDDEERRRIKPVLLDLGSGDGRVCVSAAKLGLVRKAIGLDVSPVCVKASRLVSFEEGVMGPEPPPASGFARTGGEGADEGRCEFYQVDLTTPPSLLLRNPHFLAERMKSATVIFLYTYPTLLEKLVPLLSMLTDENEADNGKECAQVVTLVYHLPVEATVEGKVRDVPETELRVYDRVVEPTENGPEARGVSVGPLPEPVDGDEFDKEFARNSIRLTTLSGRVIREDGP